MTAHLKDWFPKCSLKSQNIGAIDWASKGLWLATLASYSYSCHRCYKASEVMASFGQPVHIHMGERKRDIPRKNKPLWEENLVNEERKEDSSNSFSRKKEKKASNLVHVKPVKTYGICMYVDLPSSTFPLKHLDLLLCIEILLKNYAWNVAAIF